MSDQPTKMNPFPGLRAFRQDEDYLFFGREEQTLKLLQRLGGHRFVAVVGTSGSGKSSLVRCGLLSELLGGKLLQAGASWEIAVTHPGGNPLALLTDALLEADLYDIEEEHVRENLLATLSRSHFGLVEAVKQADLGEGTNFLLVVDQFEEIFRFHEAGQLQQEVANEFVSILLEAAAQKEVPIYVVLTMRSDFIGECGQFEGLAEMVNQGEFLIPRMTREQYKRVIEGPIKVAGGQIAPRLLQRLLNDLGQQADQLPCLQHALMRTWNVRAEQDDSDALDLDDYQRVGKMSQALSLHADEIYNSLANDRQRELCRGIFQALTVQESENRGIRRPQRLGALCRIQDVEATELQAVMEAYRQSGVTFLMPPSDVELTPETIIDISHESLMRVWTRLRHWVEEEAQAARIYRRLSESAALYEQEKAGLYRDPELGIALAWRDDSRPNTAWAARYHGDFDRAMKFLEASQIAGQAEEREKEASRQRELKQAQKLAEAEHLRAADQQNAARRLRWMVGGLAVVAVVALLASIIANIAKDEAGRLRVSALALQMEAEEKSRLLENKNIVINRNLYAAQMAHASQAFMKPGGLPFVRDLTDNWLPQPGQEDLRGWEWYFLRSEFDRESRSFSRDHGKVVWTANGIRLLKPNSEDLSVAVCDADTGAILTALPPGSVKSGVHLTRLGPKKVSISDDGNWLAVGQDDDGVIKIWDLQSGDLATTLPSLGQGAPIGSVELNADGTRVAVALGSYPRRGGVDLKIMDTKTGALLTSLPIRGNWSINKQRLAMGQQDGVIKIWDLPSGDLATTLPSQGDPIRTVELNSDGTRVAFVVGGGMKVAAIDVNTGAEAKLFSDEHQRLVHLLAWSPDDRRIASGSLDKTIKLWDAQTGEWIDTFRGHAELILDLDWSPDGEHLISHSLDGVKIWDANVRVQSGSPPKQSDKRVGSLTWSPNGQLLSWVTLPSNQITLWNTQTSQVIARLRDNETGSSADVAVTWSPDSRHFAYNENDDSISIWDTQTRRVVHSIPGQARRAPWLAWSPNGDLLASASSGENEENEWIDVVKIWNTQTLELHTERPFPQGTVISVAWSPDGTFLILGAGNKMLNVWDVDQQQPIYSWISSMGPRRAAWNWRSGDLRVATMAFGDSVARIFNTRDVSTGTLELRGHTDWIKNITWSPDGTRIATGGEDDTLKIWDAETGREVLSLDLGNRGIQSLDWSPEGQKIAIGYENGHIDIWDASRGYKQEQLRIAKGGVATQETDQRADQP